MNGDWVSGPETLNAEEMGASRYDMGKVLFAHPLDDEYYKAMAPDWSKVKVPMLSAANWGGQPLHPRGNFEGFFRAASKQKWLEVHGIEHWTHYYTDYGVGLQKRFFGYFLKGERNGWDKQPRVQLNVRHPGEKFVIRARGRLAATAHAMDQISSGADAQKLAPSRPATPARVDLRRHGRRRHLPDRADAAGNRDHRPGGGQARRLVIDRGRRPVRGAARVLARHEGSRLPGRARSAHRDRPGLAARLAPQARQETDAAVPALPHAR